MLEKIKIISKLMRPHHYIKNSFVFTGITFAHQWNIDSLISALLVFVAFCFIASSVYIFNDIIDIEKDKNHPEKFNRPLPRNQISIFHAYLIMAILMFISFFITYFINNTVSFLIFGYVFLNLFYSLWLKNIVILDIFIISMGFMCRILAGTLGLHIEPSQWLLLCGFTITLFLGFSKRFSEIKTLETSQKEHGITRLVLVDYNAELLEKFMTIAATCTIMAYALYTVSSETLRIHGNVNLIYSLPIVIYGVFRYLYLIYTQQKGSDTSKDILTDKHMLITIIAWLITIIWLLA
jgi:4-hydroxybenzoate polyprenyltransferase